MKKLLLVLFLSGLIFQNSGMYRVSAKKMHERFQTQFRPYVPAQLTKQKKCVAPIVKPDRLNIFMPLELFDLANTRHWSTSEKCLMALLFSSLFIAYLRSEATVPKSFSDPLVPLPSPSDHSLSLAHNWTSSHNATKSVFIFMGNPCTGKGTLAKNCVEKMGFKIEKIGKMIHKEIVAGGARGEIIASRIQKDGKISIKGEVIADWLAHQTSERPIILDGFPRSLAQAQMLSSMCPTCRFHVVVLKADDEEELFQRCFHRLICSNKACGATYNISSLKTASNLTCKQCGAPLIKRRTDEKNYLRARSNTRKQNLSQMLPFFAAHDIPVLILNASATPSEVFEQFKAIVK